MRKKLQLFSPEIEGTFHSRPNRFVINLDTRTGIKSCHCPNPGRMQEFLTQGRPMMAREFQGGARKYRYSLEAVRYKGSIIPLSTISTNKFVCHQVLPSLFPGFHIRSEYRMGRSRFDFLLTPQPSKEKQKPVLMEVKSCTLIEEELALFPDAPSERATRHIRHLVESRREGYSPEVLFVIYNPSAKNFAPNVHTDPVFAQTLLEARKSVKIRTVLVHCHENGYAEILPSPVSFLEEPTSKLLAAPGLYLIQFQLPPKTHIEFGKGGTFQSRNGWYIYVGSAKKGLEQRIARHLRKKKRFHWHIDYALQYGYNKKAFPLRTFLVSECQLAKKMEGFCSQAIPGFGAGDCNCGTHLFYFDEEPLRNEKIVQALFALRHRSYL